MVGSEKINIITLGCSKNLVDSEHIATQLASMGYELMFDSDSVEAKILIINTCGFIGDAKQESVDMILKCAEAKSRGEIEKLFVIGCLSERYADDLRKELPEVDEFFGARNIEGVVEQLGVEWRESVSRERIISTPKHYAYLKIAEGCNWHCGFCAIPLIRGEFRSMPMEQILEEARNLARKGVREIMVIAQDITFYGKDLYGERKLAELLTKLCAIEGIEWIRLHYAYPTDFPEDVIDVMAREDKICKYLDIPLQHISDNQLKLMRRRHTKAQAYELVERLRAKVPDVAIRTTLLVGYPDESERDFEELKEFVDKVKFERLGVFSYSEEEGTYSARKLTDNVPQEVKEQRAEQIMELQSGISHELNFARVGCIEKVVIDSLQGDYYVARSQYDSPEVDTEILIEAERGELTCGEFYTVRITGAEEYDLYGEVVNVK